MSGSGAKKKAIDIVLMIHSPDWSTVPVSGSCPQLNHRQK
jgi:hypothetical protein